MTQTDAGRASEQDRIATTDPTGVWIGALCAITSVAVVILGWFAFEYAHLTDTLAQFGAELPALSQLVINPTYLRAVPVTLLGLLVAANLWLPRSKPRLAGLALTAVLGVAAVVLGHWGARLPFTQVADEISGE